MVGIAAAAQPALVEDALLLEIEMDIAAAALVDAALTLEIETGDWERRIDKVAEEIADAQMAAVAACPGIAVSTGIAEKGDWSDGLENWHRD
jgi:hypothetical protein